MRNDLAELNIELDDLFLSNTQEAVNRLSEEEYQIFSGNYLVRSHVTQWLVGLREPYWEVED